MTTTPYVNNRAFICVSPMDTTPQPDGNYVEAEPMRKLEELTHVLAEALHVEGAL